MTAGTSLAWNDSHLRHDIRGNIALARGALDLLEHRHAAALTEPQRSLLMAAARALEDAERLCTAPSTDSSSTSVSTVPGVDASAVARGVLGEFSAVSPSQRAVCSELPVVRCEEVALRRILRNLVSNAYVHGGRHVWLETHASEAPPCLVVRDDGPGIDPRDVLALFHPKPASAEHGHGLPATLDLVVANRGRMWVEAPLTGGVAMAVQFRGGE